MKIKNQLLEYVSGETSKENRLKTAEGDVFLLEDEMVTALAFLLRDKDKEVASRARVTFEDMHFTKVARALTARLDPFVIEEIYRAHSGGSLVLNMMLLNENTPERLLLDIATRAGESALSILAYSEKMIGNTELLAAVRNNTQAQPATIAASEKTFASPMPESKKAKSDGLYDSLLDYTKENIDEKNIFQSVLSMSIVQKIKLAMIGNREARNILLNESNKVILKCVIKNPRITDEEVITLAASKTASEEILREIASKKEWMKNYAIKRSLTFNSKTPVQIALKYLNFMREKDVTILSRSKSVPGVIRSTAIRRLEQIRKN